MNYILDNKERLNDEYQAILDLQKIYEKESLDEPNSATAIRAYRAWYNKVYTICSLVFGEKDNDVVVFSSIDNNYNGYILQDNYGKVSGVYTKLQYRLKMHIDGVNYSVPNTEQENESREELPPLVFISHASADKQFASALVTLLEQQGLTHNEIFCSSVEGYGFDVGDDIYSGLLKKFHDYKLFLLFVHSPRFYARPITLNEMGAAWALKTQHASILTPDMDYEDMTGVVNNHEIAVKVNANDAKLRMTQIMNRVRKFFGKEKVDSEVWERQRDEFLDRVNAMVYLKEETLQQSKNEFSNEQIERLKNWIRSDETELFIIKCIDGGEIDMGDSYTISNAEDEVEWQDFIDKLEEMELIKRTGRYQDDEPIYRRTKKLNIYLSGK